MTAMTTDWRETLRARSACAKALTWAEGYPSFQAAWDVCPRGDWMLWWIGRATSSDPMSAARRPIVRIACQCARLALPFVRAGETRPLAAIELTERWAHGDDTVTLAEIRVYTSYAAAEAAAYAVYTASSAAYAAAAAVYASYAANAAAAAVYAAYAADAAYADARANALALCADFVRREYPCPPIAQAEGL